MVIRYLHTPLGRSKDSYRIFRYISTHNLESHVSKFIIKGIIFNWHLRCVSFSVEEPFCFAAELILVFPLCWAVSKGENIFANLYRFLTNNPVELFDTLLR